MAVFASGSLSHHFADNGRAPEFMHKVYDPFLEQVDRRVVELWQQGDWKTFIGMLPMYADKCWGEGDMHDTYVANVRYAAAELAKHGLKAEQNLDYGFFVRDPEGIPVQIVGT